MKIQNLSSTCLLGIGLAVLPASSFGAVTFTFNFNDSDGFGFNDGSEGIARQGALQGAADYISTFLTGYTANIVLDVNGSVTNDNTLAAASSHFNYYPGPDGFDGAGDVQRKIIYNLDPDAGPDGEVIWNFDDFAWATGDTVGAGEFDFKSTAIHELTHALGFASDILPDGKNGYGVLPGNPGAWSPFDEFVADSTGALINSNFELDGTRWDAASRGGTGATGLAFIGANAMAANDDNPVYLFSPNEWAEGSSGSHLDTTYYTGTGGTIENMMNHESTFGPGELDLREYTPIEIGVMRDIGYTLFGVSAVPEAGQTALVLGLGFLGFLGIRKRRMAAAAQAERSAA